MSVDVINNKFAVTFEYPVYFAEDIFSPRSGILSKIFNRFGENRRHCAIIFADSGLLAARPGFAARVEAHFEAHSESMKLIGKVNEVPGGATAKKDTAVFSGVLSTLLKSRLDRQSYVVVIGGGSVLDTVGFASSMVHRGLRVVRCPSTVLAQDDAGIGVKNGVDRFGQKNCLGFFSPPAAVINDVTLLDSLPENERHSGFAEAVKVAVIRDADFFKELENRAAALLSWDISAVRSIMKHCAAIHLRQICTGGDPFEFGSARPLDFGHWCGHRLEIITEHRIGHGFAVAAGIALDSVYAAKTGRLSISGAERILSLLESLGFRTYYPEMSMVSDSGELEIIQGLRDFREHLGGELCVTLPVEIGHSIEVHEMDAAAIRASVAVLKERSRVLWAKCS